MAPLCAGFQAALGAYIPLTMKSAMSLGNSLKKLPKPYLNYKASHKSLHFTDFQPINLIQETFRSVEKNFP